MRLAVSENMVNILYTYTIYCILRRSVLFRFIMLDSSSLCSNHYLVSRQFREQAAKVDRKDFRAIEHYLRHGYKQKKTMEMPGFRFASFH